MGHWCKCVQRPLVTVDLRSGCSLASLSCHPQISGLHVLGLPTVPEELMSSCAAKERLEVCGHWYQKA